MWRNTVEWERLCEEAINAVRIKKLKKSVRQETEPHERKNYTMDEQLNTYV